MNIVLRHNHFDQNHVDNVAGQMETLGAPTIRVYRIENEYCEQYQAIEGSHRLRACELLGIEPIIVILDDDINIEGLDLDGDIQAGSIDQIKNEACRERPYSIEF